MNAISFKLKRKIDQKPHRDIFCGSPCIATHKMDVLFLKYRPVGSESHLLTVGQFSNFGYRSESHIQMEKGHIHV